MISFADVQNQAEQENVSPSLIFKEQVHLLVLDFLFKKGLFSKLVFQGGTALRIVYQGVRYSEDLDFVLVKKDGKFLKELEERFKELPSYLNKYVLFAKEIKVKSQKQTAGLFRFHLIIRNENLKFTDRTNIEVANIPSYENETRIITVPRLGLNPAIRVESVREILSDKFCAFAARDYVKGRDIWDLHFLMDTMKIEFDKLAQEMVLRKFSDYGVSRKILMQKIEKNLTVLKLQGREILKAEMERFLPLDYLGYFKENQGEILSKVSRALERYYAGFKES